MLKFTFCSKCGITLDFLKTRIEKKVYLHQSCKAEEKNVFTKEVSSKDTTVLQILKYAYPELRTFLSELSPEHPDCWFAVLGPLMNAASAF